MIFVEFVLDLSGSGMLLLLSEGGGQRSYISFYILYSFAFHTIHCSHGLASEAPYNYCLRKSTRRRPRIAPDVCLSNFEDQTGYHP